MRLPIQVRHGAVASDVMQPIPHLTNAYMREAGTYFVGVIIPAAYSSVRFASALSGWVPASLSSFDERGTHESGVVLRND